MNKPEASIAIQVLPQVQGDETLRIVDEVIAHIRSYNLPTMVGPFETTIEGDYETLMKKDTPYTKQFVEASVEGPMQIGTI